MSGDIPKWEQLAGDDSFITRNAALNTLIIQIAQEPNPHLDEILEKGMDKHPVADKAESILTSLVRKNGEAQAVYMKAVPFRVFDHVGVQLPKLAFPEEGKALVVTESPADLVETAFEFYSSAADQYVEGMENIWRKLQRIPLSPEARAYEAGINALSYLSRVWPRRRRAFAHTIKEIHSTMMEYLFHLAIHNKIDYHSLEFDARQLVRNAYKTAQIIDKKFGLQRSKPNLEKTIRTQLPPYKTVREIDSPLTLEEDPRKMPAETVDMQDSNPYVDAMFGHITDEILTANGETTRTDAEHEPYIDPKAETVIQADTTVPYPPGYIGEADRTKAMELPNPAKPVQKIPDMKPGPRIWQSQAELMEHYFPFLLRDAVDDYPGRPADEIYFPEIIAAAKQEDDFKCTLRLGRKGEYQVILTDTPRRWHNHMRRSMPLTEPTAYITTHFEKKAGIVKASVCIGGQWEDFEFKNPDYNDGPLTVDDL